MTDLVTTSFCSAAFSCSIMQFGIFLQLLLYKCVISEVQHNSVTRKTGQIRLQDSCLPAASLPLRLAASLPQQRVGGLAEGCEHAAALLSVKMAHASFEACVEKPVPLCQQQTAPSGVIHIDLPGRIAISVESGADAVLLRTILESLRK